MSIPITRYSQRRENCSKMGVAILSSREAVTSGSATPKVRLSMLFKSTLPLRFWSKVYADPSGCWLWLASRDRDGYGRFFETNIRLHKRAHRVAYEDVVGPIPIGLSIDHLCRNTPCVNPRHLEPVTNQVNSLRGNTFAARFAGKSHCPRGHPYDLFNTQLTKRGYRQCRTCRNEQHKAKRRRRKEREAVAAQTGRYV